ncbi:glycosyltransferase family 39 protein [Sinosporangium siamense]|uniref:glycosyltransferase family 39 protein n=1 Tax=Sinosporangium siamense TaxID=1367973 RepID=UPI00194F819C|nr:glycosyltransferase family 39 protein [Sinosporangium siamense]
MRLSRSPAALEPAPDTRRRSWPSTVIPAVLAAVAGLIGVTGPSLWRDESVSAMAARMPLPGLWRLLGEMDAVHGLYYLLLRPFAHFEPVELWLRLLSVLATAAAACGVAALARRLAGAAAGLSAGTIYALLPMVSRYAQEARGYALVSAVAVLATWLLVEYAERGGRRWVGYAASVALLGWLHLYALLLLPAHAVAARWRVLLPWAVAGAALLPLAAVAAGQRGVQVFWLKTPGVAELAGFPVEVAGGAGGAVLVFGLAAVGAWAARRTPLVAAWAFLPVVLSFVISQVQPVYHPRYVMFVVPGLALAAGIGAAHLASLVARRFAVHAGVSARGGRGRAVSAGVLVGLMALTAGPHLDLRRPGSRPDDLRSLTAALAADVRPGDRVLFVPERYRLFTAVYGGAFDTLADLTHAPGAAAPRTGPELGAALRGVDRVWLVSPRIGKRYAKDERLLVLRELYRPAPTRTYGDVHLTLFTPVKP